MCAKLSRVRCITFRVLARLRSERTTRKPDETDSMAAWGADARYTRLVSEHADRLLHLAVLMTGNRHDAEDIVQDVLSSSGAGGLYFSDEKVFTYLLGDYPILADEQF